MGDLAKLTVTGSDYDGVYKRVIDRSLWYSLGCMACGVLAVVVLLFTGCMIGTGFESWTTYAFGLCGGWLVGMLARGRNDG